MPVDKRPKTSNITQLGKEEKLHLCTEKITALALVVNMGLCFSPSLVWYKMICQQYNVQCEDVNNSLGSDCDHIMIGI